MGNYGNDEFLAHSAQNRARLMGDSPRLIERIRKLESIVTGLTIDLAETRKLYALQNAEVRLMKDEINDLQRDIADLRGEQPEMLGTEGNGSEIDRAEFSDKSDTDLSDLRSEKPKILAPKWNETKIDGAEFSDTFSAEDFNRRSKQPSMGCGKGALW